MLQYPVQLPPLSLSSSKSKHAPPPHPSRDVSDDPRMTYAAFSHPHAMPLNIPPASYRTGSPSTASPASPSFPSASTASPSSKPIPVPPSPSLYSSKPIPRSPLVVSRQLPSPGMAAPSHVRSATRSSSQDSFGSQASSSSLADVLFKGDLVGEGLSLQGELIRRVPITPQSSAASMFSRDDEREGIPAKEFEVVRKLGTGSYAVVYLVREVLSRKPSLTESPSVSSDDGHGVAAVGKMDMSDDGFSRVEAEERVYGREYAIKVLSKANLDEDALGAQLFEATIHQTLRPHPNIVTLHRTLESPSFLLLLLEFVPGEDLFYFLEQSRDHFSPPNMTPSTSPPSPTSEVVPSSSSGSGHTPPTPSLLSNIHPTHLLSQTRLKLIASMFGQMCDAVAACHEQSIFHRDIKPENFIVTDGFTDKQGRDGGVTKERKVVVKLTDFGLGTMDEESADMDCGSAPYMSFECRNNIHPTYRPRAADVWSLGIVLINMLYHCNPWSDTTQGVCSAFEMYLAHPIQFFMTRFTGLTYPVAEFFATRVFCLLEDPHDDSPRITAAEFGRWVKDLPSMLGHSERPGHTRNLSMSSTVGYTLASIPASRRPSVRHQHAGETRTSRVMGSSSRVPSVRTSWALSRNPSFGFGPGSDLLPESLQEASVLPPVIDQDIEAEAEAEANAEVDAFDTAEQEPDSRTGSTQKRRKRGARKGKGAASSSSLVGSPTTPTVDDETLNTLAQASQALAREISRTSKGPTALQVLGLSRPDPVDALGQLHSSSSVLLSSSSSAAQSSPHSFPQFSSVSPTSSAPPPAAAPAPITKKPSKWKLGFGRASHSSQADRTANAVSQSNSSSGSQKQPSAVAHNVTNLLMGLNAPNAQPQMTSKDHLCADDASAWARGRRPRVAGGSLYSGSNASATWGPASAASAFGATGPYAHSNGSNSSWNATGTERNLSPTSTRSGKPLASSASSMASSNWRSSMSSTGTANSSTSAFTRYSNGSARSVSTAATSVSSASSWRSGGSKYPYEPGQLPPNVKLVTGTPWELDQLPRQMHPNPNNVEFGQPPPRKRRAPKAKESKLDGVNKLDTINEWPAKSPLGMGARSEAATSTTDLDRLARDGGNGSVEDDGTGTSPRKVQKGQINALAKMLSALRR
ncbi:kinase-like protein [Cristinia sonorae]|uniref:Kinase-like protein n=1 Tax=Cristinia sonorae TaxID=1940300 RepID=A0A8K0XVB4_9AGAR|nr:kinase-like protein [Cristinia sonorae]